MSEKLKADAILLCGGKGKRLRSLTDDAVPKSLFPVSERELIKYSLDLMDPALVSSLIFAIDYKAEQMQKWVEDLAIFDFAVKFSTQTDPGVLGGIMAALNHTLADIVVSCNTDEIRQGFLLAEVLEAHRQSGRLATIVGTYANNLSRHRLLNIREKDNLVVTTALKPEEYKNHPERYGLVNTGFLVLDQLAFELADQRHSTDWGGLIDPLTDAGELHAFVAKNGVYFNVGTPEEYQEAEKYFSAERQPEPEQK